MAEVAVLAVLEDDVLVTLVDMASGAKFGGESLGGRVDPVDVCFELGGAGIA